MEQGIRIRASTTQSIIHTLTPKYAESLKLMSLTNVFSRLKVAEGPKVLELRSSLIGDPCTRAAVKLLENARVWGQQRSERMWENVIKTTLMQGEIIVASLLFVLLIKDWELRKALADAAREPDDIVQPTSNKQPFRLPPDVYARRSPHPSVQIMNLILKEIDKGLCRTPQSTEDEGYKVIHLQALAMFAMLLDTGQLPPHSRAAVIRSLYSCPKLYDFVWIKKHNGRAIRVCAYPYFQQVLMRLIESLRTPCRSNGMRLDLRSYNALLWYALRHRLSPDLASRVLDHMCKYRDPPLQPNVVTYNILLRAGTLVRENDISETALQALRRHKPNHEYGITAEPPAHRSRKAEQDIKVEDTCGDDESKPPTVFFAGLRRLATEQMRVPESTFLSPTLADATTLNSYITHLTSSGSPEVVADVLFIILPELRIIDHPSWGSLTSAQRGALRRESKEVCLRRAVRHGPYVFAAILNALVKAGKLGLAERVWLLAKQAESASWIPGFVPGVAPWFLPIHAYTTMLQGYAHEARKRISRLRREHDMTGMASHDDEQVWRAVSAPAAGWARFTYVAKQWQIRTKTRRASWPFGVEALLYRCMRSGGQMVYRSLMALRGYAPRLKESGGLPCSDARFFNAALELFGRHPTMQPRAKARRNVRWIRKSRLAYTHEQQRRSPRLSNSGLWEVANDMLVAGFRIPLGFQHLLPAGLASRSLSLAQPTRTLDRRPYAFPPVHSRFVAHGVCAIRTRGLPLRRRLRRDKRRKIR